MEGMDFSKLMGNIDGNPENVWKEVDKMMKGLKLPTNGDLEIPIIVTHYSKKESDELSRILHGEEKEEMDVSESVSLATIKPAKVSSYHKLSFDGNERTVVIMDNGIDYEANLPYDEFKKLVSVN